MQWHNAITVGAGITIVLFGGFAIWRSYVPAAPITPAIAQPVTDPMVAAAIENEAQRIVSFAATDPECGVAPKPVDCFLDRLEQQNREAIGRELFRMEALKVAREGQSGN